MHITVVGTGYVGLVSGTCLSEIGHHVTCIDIDEKKVALLEDGVSPIYEPGLDKMIKRNLVSKRLSFSTELAPAIDKSTAVLIAVGTPEAADGSCDLSFVKAVAKSIGELITKKTLVIVKSTVPVGTGDMVEEVIKAEIEKRNIEVDFNVASNPEFLKEGAAVGDFMKPDRIIVGVESEWAAKQFENIYSSFITDDPHRMLVMSRRSSEMTKYAANSMLATRISFMNELSHLCEKVGADINDIRLGMGSDPRIGRKFLYAGPGYGGSCFPKDVSALIETAQKEDINLSVLESVRTANHSQKMRVAEKIHQKLGDLTGKKVAVWGLAFKPETDDVREAPAKTIIEYLVSHGANVVGHDPIATPNFSREMADNERLKYEDDSYEGLKGADALVLLTEWKEYKNPDWSQVADLMKGNTVFDYRNQFIGGEMAEHGLVAVGIGR